MYIKTKAIVLSSIRYNDADLIIKCYTKSSGIVNFIAKGVLKSKRAKLRPAMFQTLNLIEIEFFYKNKGKLEYFKEVKATEHLNSIQSDIFKSSIVMFLSEILKTVIFEEEPNNALFDFLENAILHLEESDKYANFHISFLVNLSSYLGFAPHKPRDLNECFFNLSEGYFETEESKYSANLRNSRFLLQFLNLSYKDSHEIKLTKLNRQELLKLILVYYQLHIENFKQPKSLDIIESIFS